MNDIKIPVYFIISSVEKGILYCWYKLNHFCKKIILIICLHTCRTLAYLLSIVHQLKMPFWIKLHSQSKKIVTEVNQDFILIAKIYKGYISFEWENKKIYIFQYPIANSLILE